MTLRLHTLITSTRPGRSGETIGTWFHDFAKTHRGFDAHLVDLKSFDLPVFDEPNHPTQRKYQHAHTKRWSASVEAADAFVFVVPEYNGGPTPALVNALTYLMIEWRYKPVGFVSYAGMSGGSRSVQLTKQFLPSYKLVAISEQVAIPSFSDQVADGVFTPTDRQTKAAGTMIDELVLWAEALKGIREKKAAS